MGNVCAEKHRWNSHVTHSSLTARLAWHSTPGLRARFLVKRTPGVGAKSALRSQAENVWNWTDYENVSIRQHVQILQITCEQNWSLAVMKKGRYREKYQQCVRSRRRQLEWTVRDWLMCSGLKGRGKFGVFFWSVSRRERLNPQALQSATAENRTSPFSRSVNSRHTFAASYQRRDVPSLSWERNRSQNYGFIRAKYTIPW